jgi:competence protein ComEC
MDVLHPPRGWVGRTANEQSVVMLLRHEGRSILLTGDVEGAGLEALLRQPARPVDVLQAPHHGSGRLDVEGLLRWCRPGLVVSCQGPPAGGRTGQTYRDAGIEFWPTWQHGAVTVRSGRGGLSARGHRGGEWEAARQEE